MKRYLITFQIDDAKIERRCDGFTVADVVKRTCNDETLFAFMCEAQSFIVSQIK